MSFDIEKRFRFVSSDDINDDISEDNYEADDLNLNNDEDEGDSAETGFKKKKKSEETTNDFEELEEEDDFDDEEDDDSDEDEE